MSDRQQDRPSALVFGARNLGKAIIERLIEANWALAGAARSPETLQGITAAGALALRADVTDRASVREAMERAADAHGGLDLVVNAASAYGGTRSDPFGGGPIAEADVDAALELRAQGIHVALLIVDAGIEPLGAAGRPGVAPDALADPRELAEAVLFLAEQGPRGATHELQVTPLAETWVP